jgi:hypothetical protein
MDTAADLRDLVDELSKAYEEEKKLAAKYHEQLLETRHQLVTQDYDRENSRKIIENLGIVVKAVTKENQVLKDLLKANAMLQLEIL